MRAGRDSGGGKRDLAEGKKRGVREVASTKKKGYAGVKTLQARSEEIKNRTDVEEIRQASLLVNSPRDETEHRAKWTFV